MCVLVNSFCVLFCITNIVTTIYIYIYHNMCIQKKKDTAIFIIRHREDNNDNNLVKIMHADNIKRKTICHNQNSSKSTKRIY